jgi:hypothetical protein
MSLAVSTIQSNLPSWDVAYINKNAATNLPSWKSPEPSQKSAAVEAPPTVSPAASGIQSAESTTPQTGKLTQTLTGELTPQQKEQVDKYKAADREVRAHEQAHLAAAGSLAMSGANFSYVTGPDGVRYAVSGDVTIDTSPVPNDPEATLQKAQEIIRAALAPAQPSPQDLRVASEAESMAFRAMQELMQQKLSAASGIAASPRSEIYPRLTHYAQPALVNLQA